ncbi:MAG TPA: precorrin-8X methylmutase [Pirellulales bacterium]|jgi:precorrin-8X/cobalt-precorrin-8 methylmutase|nr:precorrin-8X methylmutase [Pirellulales bacterium]
MNRILNPEAIEAESFRIIESEMGPHPFTSDEFAIVQRAIHSTADFEFARNIRFAPGAIRSGIEAIRAGASVVADVQMVQAGINKPGLKKFGGEVLCFIGDDDVAAQAREAGLTRAIMSMRKAAERVPGAIYAIGNAPTALLELIQLADTARPALVVGVPVGFVSAVESKDELAASSLPFITALGRKGGTPVAVSMMNALIRLAAVGQ